MFIFYINTNNHASFHLWWKENLIKYQKVSKYYAHDCRHHGRKSAPLRYCLRSLQGQFCGIVDPISEFFWNCLEKWIHLFLTERFPNPGGFHRKCFQNHEIVCSRKVSYNLVFFWSSTPAFPVWKYQLQFHETGCFIWSISI